MKKVVIILHSYSEFIFRTSCGRINIIRETIKDQTAIARATSRDIETEDVMYIFMCNSNEQSLRGHYCHEMYITSKRRFEMLESHEFFIYRARIDEAINRAYGGKIPLEEIPNKIKTLNY